MREPLRGRDARRCQLQMPVTLQRARRQTHRVMHKSLRKRNRHRRPQRVVCDVSASNAGKGGEPGLGIRLANPVMKRGEQHLFDRRHRSRHTTEGRFKGSRVRANSKGGRTSVLGQSPVTMASA